MGVIWEMSFSDNSDREVGIRRLMNINLLKRLESSVHSFKLTVSKIKKLIDDNIELIENSTGAKV